jgi:hypothetical protein
MKYTPELTEQIVDLYKVNTSIEDIVAQLIERYPEISERSIIAKLSSSGNYKKKVYLTKQGNLPIKKEAYIDMIAKQLEVDATVLESLEKVNKQVLALIYKRLSK